MTITYETSSTGDFFTTSLSVSPPADIADDDLIVGLAVLNKDVGNIVEPSGFTVVSDEDLNGGSCMVAYKVASSESGNYAWTTSVAGHWCVVMGRISGVDTTTPMDATATTNGATSTAPSGSSITTVTDGAMLVWAAATRTQSGNFTAPGSMTEKVENSTRGGANFSEETQTTAGASGAKTGAFGSSVQWSVTLLALRPAAGGGVTVPALDEGMLVGGFMPLAGGLD